MFLAALVMADRYYIKTDNMVAIVGVAHLKPLKKGLKKIHPHVMRLNDYDKIWARCLIDAPTKRRRWWIVDWNLFFPGWILLAEQ